MSDCQAPSLLPHPPPVSVHLTGGVESGSSHTSHTLCFPVLGLSPAPAITPSCLVTVSATPFRSTAPWTAAQQLPSLNHHRALVGLHSKPTWFPPQLRLQPQLPPLPVDPANQQIKPFTSFESALVSVSALGVPASLDTVLVLFETLCSCITFVTVPSQITLYFLIFVMISAFLLLPSCSQLTSSVSGHPQLTQPC